MNKLKELVKKSSRIPLLFPVTLVLAIVFGLITMLHWLIGYWCCDVCGNTYWADEEKRVVHYYDYRVEMCSKCGIEKEEESV